MRLKNLLFLVPVILSVTGCNIINPAEPVPTYIKIDSFHFVSNNPVKEGPISQGITNVWIYYNNSPVGAFDLPCNVPVITDGEKGQISVAPGIKLNGLVALQPQYPFYRFDATTLITNPGNVQEFIPTTSYIDAAKFPYKEDFEVGNSFQAFIPEATDDTSIFRTTDPDNVLTGGGAGMIYLTSEHAYSQNISNTGFDIPQGEAYIEINYKGNISFEVGLYNTLTNGVDAYDSIFGVNASDTWKKIYIELASYTGANKGTNYKVMIMTSLKEGQTSGHLAIDNIKVVTF
ncbi:MAG: hypothetical protein KDC07_02540 [Chitinophagaceae bacterium]|nr:hypothetical protein [Chitinophagaceae bacterium]